MRQRVAGGWSERGSDTTAASSAAAQRPRATWPTTCGNRPADPVASIASTPKGCPVRPTRGCGPGGERSAQCRSAPAATEQQDRTRDQETENDDDEVQVLGERGGDGIADQLDLHQLDPRRRSSVGPADLVDGDLSRVPRRRVAGSQQLTDGRSSIDRISSPTRSWVSP